VFSAAVHRVFGNLEVVDEYTAFVGLHKAGGHVEGGCLAGSVRAEQTYNLALCHTNRHMVYHCTLAVFLYQIVGAEYHQLVVAGCRLYFEARAVAVYHKFLVHNLLLLHPALYIHARQRRGVRNFEFRSGYVALLPVAAVTVDTKRESHYFEVLKLSRLSI
jgi:hypothetical protein